MQELVYDVRLGQIHSDMAFKTQLVSISGPHLDSLFDSVPGAVCDTPGHSVSQTRQTGEYTRHVLTLQGTS